MVEPSQVAAARRLASQLASQLGFTTTDTGKVALVVTEMATNLVKHARGGQLLLQPLVDTHGMALLALDAGPGMPNVRECLQDGYSTAGSPGTGLGAITRLATHWDIYSVLGTGTVLFVQMLPVSSPLLSPASGFASLWASSGQGREPFFVEGLCVPKAGEDVCGDAWTVVQQADYCTVMVADGLGHGLGAAEAAQAAVRVVHERPLEPPTALLECMHARLRPTRGAAVGVAVVHRQRQEVTFAGVDNITGTIVRAENTRALMSHNGIVGHQMRKVQALTYPWDAQALLVLHSDGLGTRWDLMAYPGLRRRRPGLIAGVLYRDFVRGRDDVTVVVIGESSASGAARRSQ
jgi:anti-sigma regulatory factor (Ser/Thr protein kinase)